MVASPHGDPDSKTLFPVAFSLLTLASLAACTAPTSSPGEDPVASGEDELKASECPVGVDVLLLKPSVAADAQLTKSWAKYMASYETDPQQAAKDQLKALASQIADARSETAVKLHGTRGKACIYATVDATTGKENEYNLWFAKRGSKNPYFELRIERFLPTQGDSLYFSASLSSLSPTAVAVEPSKDATVYAKHLEYFHGEPDGTSAWIGSAGVTVTLAP